ncbi:MAG: hypothetical protein KIT27_07305 [Legionellales bacterium]|nr:hypothetical protein [Legionellales bacterium]
MGKLASYCENFLSSWNKRWQCFVVESIEDLAECDHLRRKVFGEELKRHHDNPLYNPGGDEVIFKNSTYIACRDNQTKKIIGLCCLTPAHLVYHYQSCRELYLLDSFDEKLLPHILIASRYAVLPQYRKSVASLAILEKVYSYALALSCPIMICVSEPRLYPMYQGLGFRPLGRMHTSDLGGYRIPLFLILHDYPYLKKLSSAFYSLIKKARFPKEKAGLWWMENHYQPPYSIGFCKLANSQIDYQKISLLQGISETGRKIILNDSLVFCCKNGEKITKKGAKETGFGYVYSGEVSLITKDKPINILRAGDWFGEAEHITQGDSEGDLIVNRANTMIISFRLAMLNHLKNDQDRSQFWQNLTNILAQKIITLKQHSLNRDYIYPNKIQYQDGIYQHEDQASNF